MDAREEALNLFEQGVSLDREAADMLKKGLADPVVLHLFGCQRQDAMKKYEEANRLLPGDPRIQVKLGTSYIYCNRPGQARTLLEEAINRLREVFTRQSELKPVLNDALAAYAGVLLVNHEHALGLETCNTVLILDPQNEIARTLRDLFLKYLKGEGDA